MKAHLLYKDRDFDLERELPRNEGGLVQDLDLSTLFEAMAEGDAFLFDVSRRVVLSSLEDPEAMTYRQRVLADCIAHPEIIREMYAISVEAIVGEKKVRSWGFYSKHPSAILRSAVDTLEMFMGLLKRLRRITDEHAGSFHSDGLATFFIMLAKELDDEYLQCVDKHLVLLKLQDGMRISAGLGKGGKGVGYILLVPGQKQKQSLKELIGIAPRSSYSFDIHPRDDAGARALRELTDRGLNFVADALAQSKDHISSFFAMLRLELGFYVSCLNLYDKLSGKGEPVCIPVPLPWGSPMLYYNGLYDVCLTLKIKERVVGNEADADGKSLVMITGANSGGKSTFLRSIGLAQLMMQCGMFVGAESYRANVCDRLFTHFIREEDAGMISGRFDEELNRMSMIAGEVTSSSIMLLNESFAATNEREGSEIASQVVRALVESGIKVFYVTHLFTLAEGLYQQEQDLALFLRAERGDNGKRSFKIIEGEPLPTSFGEDIYKRLGGLATTPVMRRTVADSSSALEHS